MKYIIDIPDEYENDYISMSPLVGKEFCYPIRNMNKTYVIPTGLKIEPYTELDRKAIEDEVWDFSMKTDFAWISEVGGKPLGDYSYQEAKSKYEAWKAEREQIRVGDEVEICGTIGIVTRVPYLDEERVHYIAKSGNVYCNISYAEIKKTGRHFDEVEELLQKMRGEEQ